MKQHLQTLSNSGLLLAARIAGAGMVFLVQAAIARTWGSTILADYLLLISAANIAGMVMPLGFQTIGSYFAVEYRAGGRGADLRRFMQRAYTQIVLTAVVMGVAAVVADPVLGLLPPTVSGLILPGFIFAVAMASVFVSSALLVGLKHPVAGLLADGLARPMMVLAGFLAALAAGGDANLGTMVWVMALGYGFVALVCLWYAMRAAGQITGQQPERPAEPARWWRFALPWVIIAVATEFFFDIDLLLLAFIMDKHELAVFGVCARIFALAAFGITAVHAVLLPGMMEAGARKDEAVFLRRLGDANLAAMLMALAIFAGSLLAGPWVLSVFGPQFAEAAGALSILCAILVVRAFFGPAELVLSLHDRPWTTMPAVIAGLASLAAANLALVPAHGVTGAAAAALAATAVWGGAKWMTVRAVTGLDVSLVGRLRSAGAAISGRAGNASG